VSEGDEDRGDGDTCTEGEEGQEVGAWFREGSISLDAGLGIHAVNSSYMASPALVPTFEGWEGEEGYWSQLAMKQSYSREFRRVRAGGSCCCWAPQRAPQGTRWGST